jgi:hypothetical protein
VTAKFLTAMVSLLTPSLAPAQTSQMQGAATWRANKSGNASDGNGAVTPTNKGLDEASDANAVTAPSSKPPIAVRRDLPR